MAALKDGTSRRRRSCASWHRRHSSAVLLANRAPQRIHPIASRVQNDDRRQIPAAFPFRRTFRSMKTSVIVGALAVLAACSGEVGQGGSGGSRSTATGAGGSTGSATGAGGTYTGAGGRDVTVGTTTTGTTTGESTTSGASGSGGAGGASGGSAGSGGDPRADAGVPRDSGAAPDAPVTTPDTKVVMYLPNWAGSFASWAPKIDFNKMTHLLVAFGTVDTGNNWNLGAADNDVKTLAAAAPAKNVKVLVSIGGADDDIGIINQYQPQSNIDPLVANLDAFVTRL